MTDLAGHMRIVPLLAVAMIMTAASGRTASAQATASAARPADATTGSPAATDPDAAEIASLVKEQKLEEAAERAEAVLARREKSTAEPPSLELAKALDSLTDAARRSHAKGEQFQQLAERAIQIKTRLLGAETAEVATSHHLLGNLFVDRRQYESARREHEAALAIREKIFGKESLEVAPNLNNLGSIEASTGNHALARDYYTRCLEIRQAKLGPDHPDLSPLLLNLGNLLTYVGESSKAEELLRRSLAIREKTTGPTSEPVADAARSLGTALQRQAKYDDAEASYRRAVEIYRTVRGPDDPVAAGTLGNVAAVLMERGDLAEARDVEETVLKALERKSADEPVVFALAVQNMGHLLAQTGDLDAARGYLERALEARRLLAPNGDIETAMILDDLAGVAQKRGDQDAARQYAEQAVTMVRPSGAGESREATLSLVNLGILATERRDYEQARRLLDRALEIQTRRLGADHPDVARTLAELGELLSRQGRYDEGMTKCREAIALIERISGPRDWRLERPLEVQARAALRAGNAREALDLALRAEAIGRDRFALVASSLSERQALDWGAVRKSEIPIVLSAASRAGAPEASAMAFDAWIRSRALVLEGMLARQRAAAASAEPAVHESFVDVQKKRRILAQTLLRGPQSTSPGEYRAALETARKEAEEAERALAAKSTRFREAESWREVGLDPVRRSLPSGSALVSYAWFPEQPDGKPAYSCFVLRAGSTAPQLVPLGPAAVIDDLVRRWRDAVAQPGDEVAYREVAKALRNAVWDPIVPRLGPTRQVFVVPDGSLLLVNLATLPDDAGGYLLERDAAIELLSSERDIVRQSQRARTSKGLVAFGAPDFDATAEQIAAARKEAGSIPASVAAATAAGASSDVTRAAGPRCRALGEVRFAPLPTAASEVQAIGKLWEQDAARNGAAIVRTGRSASKFAFEESAPNARVLHLATHSFEVTPQCATSIPGAISGSGNPLYLTGLAMAGANHRADVPPGSTADDGMLTAAELAAMDLAGVDLAVLAACESGGGNIVPSEGVVGLRRAFLTAGARTMVLSLWRIQDEFATEWMSRLYRARGKTKVTPSEAARRASLAMLHDLRKAHRPTHPFYWGAFVAVGESR